MRVFGHCLLGVCVTTGWVFAQAPPASPAQKLDPVKAEATLADARKALGGDKLATVKTVLLTGQTRKLQGNNLVPIEFEISIELPDKYVRKDEFPAQDTGETVAGFRGDELILSALPPGAHGGPPGSQRLNVVRQDFARLMLGAFAASLPSYPLTFTYAGEGEVRCHLSPSLRTFEDPAGSLDGHGLPPVGLRPTR